jgi:hypothetical protein
MGADRFFTATNPTEMGIGSQSDDTAAIRTKIAFKMKAGGIALKVPGGEAVPMDLVMVAFRANIGPFPQIIFALLKNILEKDGNKTYHVDHFCLGVTPQVVQGGEFARTLHPIYFQKQKKDLL